MPYRFSPPIESPVVFALVRALTPQVWIGEPLELSTFLPDYRASRKTALKIVTEELEGRLNGLLADALQSEIPIERRCL